MLNEDIGAEVHQFEGGRALGLRVIPGAGPANVHRNIFAGANQQRSGGDGIDVPNDFNGCFGSDETDDAADGHFSSVTAGDIECLIHAPS